MVRGQELGCAPPPVPTIIDRVTLVPLPAQTTCKWPEEDVAASTNSGEYTSEDTVTGSPECSPFHMGNRFSVLMCRKLPPPLLSPALGIHGTPPAALDCDTDLSQYSAAERVGSADSDPRLERFTPMDVCPTVWAFSSRGNHLQNLLLQRLCWALKFANHAWPHLPVKCGCSISHHVQPARKMNIYALVDGSGGTAIQTLKRDSRPPLRSQRPVGLQLQHQHLSLKT